MNYEQYKIYPINHIKYILCNTVYNQFNHNVISILFGNIKIEICDNLYNDTNITTITTKDCIKLNFLLATDCGP